MFSLHLLQYFKCGTKPVTPSSASKSFPDKSISIMDVSVEDGERGGEVVGGEGEGEGVGEGGEKGEGGREGEGEGKRGGGEAGGEEGTGCREKEQDVRKNGAGLKVVREGEGEGVTVEDKEGDRDSTRKRRRDEVRLIIYNYRLSIVSNVVCGHTCRTLLKIVIAMWRKLSRQFHHPKSRREMTLR